MKKLITLILITLIGILFVMILFGCSQSTCPAYSKYKATPRAYGMSPYQSFYSPTNYRK